MKLGIKKSEPKVQFLDVEDQEHRNKRLGLLLPKQESQLPVENQRGVKLKSKLKNAAFDAVIDDVSSQLLRPLLLAIATAFAFYLPSTTPSGLALFLTAIAAPFVISFTFNLGKNVVRKCAKVLEKEMAKNAIIETYGALKKAGYVVYESASLIVLRKAEPKLQKPEEHQAYELQQPWNGFNNPPVMLLRKPTGKSGRVLIEEIEPKLIPSSGKREAPLPTL